MVSDCVRAHSVSVDYARYYHVQAIIQLVLNVSKSFAGVKKREIAKSSKLKFRSYSEGRLVLCRRESISVWPLSRNKSETVFIADVHNLRLFESESTFPMNMTSEPFSPLRPNAGAPE